jgi:hypothetical protein
MQQQDLSSLRVQGNTIVNGAGQKVWLRGVDRSGTEFMCLQGKGFYDGPVDDASINTIQSWKANIVRIPLNEDCWLGINGVPSQTGGENYINAITTLVNRFSAHGMAVILDLHWSAPGNQQANKQTPMPDTEHSVDFWTGVAKVFGSKLNVIFDLFNEPFPDNGNWNSTAGWNCLLNGGNCPGLGYSAAGMQSLVNAVRKEGSRNILMVGGLAYSNSLAKWLEYMPNDPLKNLAASWHSYNFNFCSNQQCWEETVGNVSRTVPVIIGESGTNQCNGNYLNSLLPWADQYGNRQSIHYLAWTWNTWNCNNGPALITNYDGTPTNYGQGYKNQLFTTSE